MRRSFVSAMWVMTLGVVLTGFIGCGGSSNTTPPPAASITSFTASAATITVGQSTTLTGVFANGTGMITPGNVAATSGTAVTVTPTATTTYTLTVTPTSGSAVTATTTVTVNPLPTIASFVASPATITAGQSATLTGVFANGTGVITPGSIAATSGTAVTVSPTATTTYTLTVTPASGSAITATATITVNPATTSVSVDLATPGIPVTDQILGMNMAAWYDDVGNATTVNSAFSQAGIKAIRWPGGSWSDDYHWGYQTSSSTLVTSYMCQTATPVTGGWGGYSTFAEFVNAIPKAGPYDLALTANYGTDEACTGPGDPNEAGAWVAAAVTDGITPSHMTVGNEEYGTWETDLHSSQHDGATYASTVVGSNGYYSLIKAASPNTLVGVDVEPSYAPWDQDVMSGAKGSYDFVEYHSYPETPGQEDDTALVQQDPQKLTANINTIKAELTKWGVPNTPIYVGEIGGPYSNPGKQSWSITQGLYAGQVLGEMMNDGISRLTWWIGFGNCNGQAGNDSASVYGWQNFGAYNVFSDGASDSSCPDAGPAGTMSPTARAFQLFSNVAINGQHVLTATVGGDTTDVRAYAATNPAGTALVLFNVNETTSEQVVVTLTGKTSSSSVKVTTYDKALYDLSGSPTGTPPDPSGTSTWAPPTITDMGAQTLPMTLTLSPWSMNVVIIE